MNSRASSSPRNPDKPIIPSVAGISVIVPTLNEGDWIPSLLRSLAGQVGAPAFEVIVADGASTDGTRAAVERFSSDIDHLRFISCPRRDVGAQRNFGASFATYDHFLFLDADVEFPSDTLAKLVRSTPAESLLVMSVVHRTKKVGPLRLVFGAVIYGFIFIALALRIPVTNGDFLFTTRKTFDKIGGFAEGAVLGEDTDFGMRAVRKSGARYKFCWGITIIASERRMHSMSLFSIGSIWIRAFWHVLRKGPVYDRRWRYPYNED